MRQLLAVLTLAALTALLALQAGCGQTGPLYLPGPAAPGEPLPPATDTETDTADPADAGPEPVT
jgi:predicted small lipoprotein YifL